MRVAIVQSNYIPWKGYFDLIRSVDLFLLYDEVQYTRRDWRNRNRIKSSGGTRWLSIPLRVKGRYEARIDEMEVSDRSWADRHWETLRHAYRGAPAFAEYEDRVRGWYETVASLDRLSDINRRLLEALCSELGIVTRLMASTDVEVERPGDATRRLATLCQAVGATEYVSGPAARDYLDQAVFEGAGITVRWADYAGYPVYDQVHPPFEHAVTALDPLFHAGATVGALLKPTVVP